MWRLPRWTIVVGMTDHVAPNRRGTAPASAPGQRFRYSRSAPVLIVASLLAFLLAACSRDTPPAAGAGPRNGDVPAAVNDQPTGGGAPATAAPPTEAPCITDPVVDYGTGSGVLHSNGLSGTFCHSTPLGSYNERLATAACTSYVRTHLGRCSTIPMCGDSAVVAWDGPPAQPVAWGYEGTGRGHLRVSTHPPYVNCPEPADPPWGDTPTATGAEPAGGATAAAPTNGDTPTTTPTVPIAIGYPCVLDGTVASYGVVHTNGLGGIFCSSTSLGTYTYELALAACASRFKDGRGSCGPGCFGTVSWKSADFSLFVFLWSYKGTTAGHLRVSFAIDSDKCPKTTDPVWI
jgi:hypothetical protein